MTRRGALIAALTGALTLTAGSTILQASPASANGSWGGYQNGRIPLSALSMVGGYYFRKDAAAAMDALRNEYRSARGKTLIINDGYRDYAGQEQALREYGRPRAAIPGTSNHGWALAVDFGGSVYNGPNNDDHRWLQANAGRFGWWWAGQYFDYFEPWHWEYNGTYKPPSDPDPTPEPPIIPEAEMFMISSPGRGTALVAAGYYRSLSPANGNEEVNAAIQIVKDQYNVTDGRFDTIRDICTSGFVPIGPPDWPGATIHTPQVNLQPAVIDQIVARVTQAVKS